MTHRDVLIGLKARSVCERSTSFGVLSQRELDVVGVAIDGVVDALTADVLREMLRVDTDPCNTRWGILSVPERDALNAAIWNRVGEINGAPAAA